MSARFSQFAPLDGERFDVVIIGGGINGVAIARECARGGKRTLLIEKNDFGSGTTSRSTRIIHGGLRYLEHGELQLVRESLREKSRLVRERPHLVRPLEFLLALPAGGRHSSLEIRLGLWAYRMMARAKRPRTSQSDVLERALDAGQHWSVFSYQDAQCEFPERLVADWLVEGLQCGLVARNHTEVLAIETLNGRVRGVRARGRRSEDEWSVEAMTVINATGPWVDSLCSRARIRSMKPLIGGVRGSHIVLPRLAGLPHSAIYTEASDGRPMFLIPWNDQLLVGTTEVSDSSDPGAVRPSADEISYLLQAVQRLFPAANVSAADIHYAFAGVRPLPYSPGTKNAAITRRHFLHDHREDGAAGFISIIGGKLTTAAGLARECAAMIGVDVPDRRRFSFAPVRGLDAALAGFVGWLAETGHINHEQAQAIAEWHGPTASAIAQIAADDQQLRVPLAPDTRHIIAEAVYAAEGEMAVTLADILLRRVPVALSKEWDFECTRAAAANIGFALGWSPDHMIREIDAFEDERAAFLPKPDSAIAAHPLPQRGRE